MLTGSRNVRAILYVSKIHNMKTFLQAKLIAHIEIEDEDFDFIKKCCKHHYDFKVKSSVEVGGFLYGYTNRREWSKGQDKVLELEFRQIDLLLKALEMGQYIELGKAAVISVKLKKILTCMNEKYAELNPELEKQLL